ncbi:hypothetical protein ASG40_12830 [Methylobacterium sp. Leaf399]|uniref:hypothetical protein n=1 Tax=unclassified Methylobacterium TaxID=2615210 RepID=UPI0006F898B5|nr:MULTISPECIES: hypothetical protein [unclassified Methylobacterium]KQP50808.1 hypothetical protein ASF39_11210 [Methylobacterium sp. Leaf108]KQT07788.1 hypothetical protein ASG40_12830 [Methylobacterium sp. Leaf399]
MTDLQLACLALSVAPLTFGALWALVDVASRMVGSADTPADPVETFHTIAGYVARLVALVPAMVLAAATMLFGWRVRP